MGDRTGAIRTSENRKPPEVGGSLGQVVAAQLFPVPGARHGVPGAAPLEVYMEDTYADSKAILTPL
jgi:hypothetical protein